MKRYKIKSVLICTQDNKNLERVIEYYGDKASMNLAGNGVIVKELGCLGTYGKECLEKVCNVKVICAIKF